MKCLFKVVVNFTKWLIFGFKFSNGHLVDWWYFVITPFEIAKKGLLRRSLNQIIIEAKLNSISHSRYLSTMMTKIDAKLMMIDDLVPYFWYLFEESLQGRWSDKNVYDRMWFHEWQFVASWVKIKKSGEPIAFSLDVLNVSCERNKCISLSWY